MKHRRILSGLAALMLAATLPMSALADTWYLEDGSITVTAGDSGQTVQQGSNAAVNDNNVTITQRDSSTATGNTVTINAEKDQTANVTLEDVNIDTSSSGGAAVSTGGEGSVTIELDGSNKVKSGDDFAGVQKRNEGCLEITDQNDDGALIAIAGRGSAGIGGGNGYSTSNITISGGDITAIGGHSGSGIGGGNDRGSGSNITISGGNVKAIGGFAGSGIGGGNGGSGSNITISGGSVEAIGGYFSSGIGGGFLGNGSNITISNCNVTAQSSAAGAGIGGGLHGEGSDITIYGDANVKVQGGKSSEDNSTGAGIGNGSHFDRSTLSYTNGAEVTPDTSKLTTKGKIEYYAPGADMDKTAPVRIIVGTYGSSQAAQPAEALTEAAPAAPLFRVTDGDGKYVKYATQWSDGVLTVTAEADRAVLTGKLSGMAALKAQGIERIVFITSKATSEFAAADLLAAGASGDSYTLTHDGETVTFTLGEADVSGILGKK